jgi:hypothetical protein
MSNEGPKKELLLVESFFPLPSKQGPDTVGSPSSSSCILEDWPKDVPGSVLAIRGIAVKGKHEKPDPVLAKDPFDDTPKWKEGKIGALLVGSASKENRKQCPVYVLCPVRMVIVCIMENRVQTETKLVGLVSI